MGGATRTEAGVFPVTTLKGREQTRLAGRMNLDDIVTEAFAHSDGHLLVPDGPGLGVDLDPNKITEYRFS